MGIFARRTASIVQAKAFYQVFQEKMHELQDYIEGQIVQWGNWESIPDNVKTFIDKEFVLLGKFGKKIDVRSLEEIVKNEQIIKAK